LGRVAKRDAGLLQAVRDTRAVHRVAVVEARKKIDTFIMSETQEVYEEMIYSIRMALIDGHSARQIGEAYGSSDPYTVKKLVDEAKLGIDPDGTEDPSWQVKGIEDSDNFELKVIAFGQDKQSGIAVFEVDEDGTNITAIDGDFWLQSVVYREGIVKEILDAR
jgi:hypothetical protein